MHSIAESDNYEYEVGAGFGDEEGFQAVYHMFPEPNEMLETDESHPGKKRHKKRQRVSKWQLLREAIEDVIDVDPRGSVRSVKLQRRSYDDVRERLSYARICLAMRGSPVHLQNNSTGLNKRLTAHNRENCDTEGKDLSSSSDDEKTVFQTGYLLDAIKRRAPKNFPHRGGSRQRLMRYLASGSVKLLDYAKDAIARDEFMSVVVEDITEFFKNPAAVAAANSSRHGAGKNRAWPKTTTAVMKKEVAKIISYKKEVKCISAEVHNWFIRKKLKDKYVIASSETARERHNRFQEFWKQYHDSFDRREIPLGIRRAESEDPSSPLSRRVATAPTARKSSARTTICFDRERQWNMIDVIDDQRKELQNRTKKSKREDEIKWGWKWNLDAKKYQWQLLSPAEGTRAFLKQSQKTVEFRSTVHRNRRASSGMVPSLGLNRSSVSAPSLSQVGQPSLSQRGQTTPILPGASSPSGKVTNSPSSKLTNMASGKVTLPPIRSVKELPTEKYLEACHRCWIVPTPLPFVTGHSWRLNAYGRNMVDGDLLALASMVKDVSGVDEVNLEGNSLLTENALVQLFDRLFGYPASESLQKLNLCGLKNMGLTSFETITRLLSDVEGARNLSSLDLSEVYITTKCHLSLAKAIREHTKLNTLRLCETQMGVNSWVSKNCIQELFRSPSLHTLDLGWNSFDVESFIQLGQCLAASPKIVSLSIANCSSATSFQSGSPPPICCFLENLLYDRTLTYLDVSLNRMDFRGPLMIEDCLERNQSLKEINVSHNQIGTLGIRSLLRLLASSTSPLRHFESQGCYHGDTSSDLQTFNMVNPTGNYELDLVRPYHRSILRMLYKSCERLKIAPDQTFTRTKYSQGAWTHPTRNSSGIFDVPTSGKLSITFSIEKVTDTMPGLDEQDYGAFLEQYMARVKTQPAFNKVVPFFGAWKMLDGHTKDQRVFLNAMSKDFLFNNAHIEELCNGSNTMRSETVVRLFPSVIGGEPAEALCMMMFKSIGEFLARHEELRTFIDFNIENPTGHYQLALDNPTDYAIAQKLLLLDRWECVLDKRQNRRDVSFYGDGCHFRNECFRYQKIRISSWMLPESDSLEFDYVSSKRVPNNAAILSDATFDNMLISIYDAACSSESKFEVLQMTSHLYYLTAAQMRKLLGAFAEGEIRVQVYVAFFLRVLDVWNAKLFRVRFHEEQDRLREITKRLGDVITFPFIQPENFNFEFDFHCYDQRVCCTLLLTLASKEGMGNIRDYKFIHADGVVDELPLGVPMSWMKLTGIPNGGHFSCVYICSPDSRNFKHRVNLAINSAAFPMDVTEEKVCWATGLQEVDESVLLFLQFLVSKYDNVFQAFTVIDGEDGNGVITLQEFKEGLKEMGCKIFRGAEAENRIAKLFRYLDPGGEGSVSQAEWGILEQLWAEHHNCVAEFVQFIQRTFGNDLEAAWEFIDVDQRGELALDEWLRAVEDIGFYGPSKVVFDLLDDSGDGNISVEEFELLDKYKSTPREAIFRMTSSRSV